MNRFVKSLLRFVLASMFAVGCAAQSQSSDRAATQAGRDRLLIAEQMFQAHCKTAGERIYKTVDNVEGIFLIRVRPERVNYHDQFAMDDPYGSDVSGDGYIKNFLRGRTENGSLLEYPNANSYRYVEAIDPKDGTRYRYTGAVQDVVHTQSILIGGDGRTRFTTRDFVLDRTPATRPTPRYGITYDDISTREDRKFWIAGSSLKVIDLQTNDIIAERVGYMMDRGQGNDSGGRSPWLLATFHACPAFPTDPGRHPLQIGQTRDFVERVLPHSRQ